MVPDARSEIPHPHEKRAALPVLVPVKRHRGAGHKYRYNVWAATDGRGLVGLDGCDL